MKNFFLELKAKIAEHKILSILTVFLVIIFISIPFVVLSISKLQQPKQAKNITLPDKHVIVVNLTYQSASKTITITSIASKPTPLSPSAIINSGNETGTDKTNKYVLQVVDEKENVLASKSFIAESEIHGDDFATQNGNIAPEYANVRTLPLIETLPSYVSARKILLKNADGELLESKSYTPPPQSSTQRIQDASGGSTDIVFVPYGFTQAEIPAYKQMTQNNINMLKTVAPWNNAPTVNYPIYDKPIPALSCSQVPSIISYCIDCNWEAIDSALSEAGIVPNNIVVVGNAPAPGTGACAGGSHVTIPSGEVINDWSILSHELGHAVGKLHHEGYESYDSLPEGPVTNEVDVNCYTGTPPTQDWSQIIPTNSYFKGCYEYNNWYRSSQISVMGSRNSHVFSPVGLWVMRQSLGIANTPITEPDPENDSCTTLQTGTVSESTTYCSGTLAENQGVSGVISVGADGIVLDGGGVVIDGGNKTGIGILLNGHNNVTIKNFTIKNFNYAISVSDGTSLTVQNNIVSGNAGSEGRTGNSQWNINEPIGSTPGGGILANNISSSTFSNNTGNGEAVGLNLYNSTGNTVSGNNFSNNTAWGIRLYASTGNTVSGNQANNVITCGSYGCDSAGILLVQGSNSNTISNNTLTNSGDGFFIGNEAGSPSNNNTISGNNGSNSPNNCFEATFSNGNTFSNNTANNCNHGFWLGGSSSTNLTGNTISHNKTNGISWANVPQNDTNPGSISGNHIDGNEQWGIWMTADTGPSNISSFPAGNTFSGNKNGNCDGTGFSSADKHGGKCPDGNATTSPTVVLVPSGFEVGDGVGICVGKGGVKLNTDGTPVFENGPTSKSGARCGIPPNFVNGYFDSARATPGNTAYCGKTFAAAYECKNGTSEFVPYPESDKCSEEPWCPAGNGNGDGEDDGGNDDGDNPPPAGEGSNPCVQAGGTCLINSSGGKACGNGGKWAYSTEDCYSTTICYKCQGSTGGVSATVTPNPDNGQTKVDEGGKCSNTSDCNSGNNCIPGFWVGGDPGPYCCPTGKRVCNYGPNAGSGCQYPADCPNREDGRTACEAKDAHCYSGNSKECCAGLYCRIDSSGSAGNKCVPESASSQSSQSIASAASECSKNSDCKVVKKNVCVLNSNNIGVCQ